MPDSPATNVDTTGVVGQTGAIPVGSQVTSGTNSDTTGTGAGAFGSATYNPAPPAVTGTYDTEGVYGPNQPSSFTPVSTLMAGSLDTTQGYAANMTQRTYRAPGATPSGSIYDTTNAYGFTAAVPTDTNQWVTGGTTETANFGAPSGSIVSTTFSRTIDQTTPTAVSPAGVIGAASSLVVSNTGKLTTATDESHVLSGLTAFTLTHPGVTDTTTAIVVKKGATTLVETVDYTIVAGGTGITRNMTITPIDSVIVNSGDTLLVSYHWGNAAYFTPVTLVLTTDYTVTFAGGMAARTVTILRAGASSAVANGDSVAITAQIGNAAYWGTHDPTTVPPTPVIGTAVVGDRRLKVVWTNGTAVSTSDTDGYLIQSDTGGTRYVPGGNLSFWFENVVPGQEYKFRVAAFNEAGLSDFSALSNAVIAANWDETPTGSLDPKNTVNYIYNADGSTVSGTGLGV